MNYTNRQQQLIATILLGKNTLTQIMERGEFKDVTERTLQRDLSKLVDYGVVARKGEARATVYQTTPLGMTGVTLSEEVLSKLFSEENRPPIRYDFTRLDTLRSLPLFTQDDVKQLERFNGIFKQKLLNAPTDLIRRERERMTIELSWKSSQFEGNTYSLLETESLIKDGVVGKGKSKEETVMILNHKHALDFTADQKEAFSKKLTPSLVIDLHKILAKGLFSFDIREQAVGITGSVYQPLDNKHQINDELQRFCDVVNEKESIFEKTLLAFTYICYLQPFNDGNKRTGRILANALLYANDSFPLSLRAVNVNTYKLAILAFYELGVLGNAKQVLIDQAKFAAEQYEI